MSKSIRFITFIFVAALILSVILRFPKENERVYYSQDASYHVLLTAYAYDETPVSVHKFLPIVTLGDAQDKNIPWGDTLSDESGNYYYTSFSAAGFFFPYLFFKVFRLPITLSSLYLFNSCLYLVCTFLVAYLFHLLFHDHPRSWMLGLLAAAIYAFQTEALHSHGVVYWHQSLFQLFFLLQAILFLKDKRVMFLLFCVLNPYTEWTGYVANAGFALICLIKKQGKYFLSICFATILALAVFILHYASVLPFMDVIGALYKRFFARGITSAVSWSAFLKGYLYSYGILLIVSALLLFLVLIDKSRRQLFFAHLREHWACLIMLLFPVMENLLMQQHVVFYTYDRLKVSLPLIYLVIICLTCFSSESADFPRWLRNSCVVITCAMACCNMFYYKTKDNFYSHTADYLADNQMLADYICEQYSPEESLIVQNNATRGYSNLLFHRGIYEYQDSISGQALLDQQRYYIYLYATDTAFNIYQYDYASVYDTISDTTLILTVRNGSVQAEYQQP